MPNSFAETPTGLLLIADGMGPMLRWDSFQAQAVPAGVAPPAAGFTLGAGGVGDLEGTYTAYCRFVDNEDNFSNLSPITNQIEISGVGEIDYFNVPGSFESKVVRRQILRNTNGQASVYYVDIDTTDLVTSDFSSTLSDEDLSAQTAVPILDSDSKIFANRFTVPPNHKGVIANHLGRMFATVDTEYSEGMVQVTQGNLDVGGIGTRWPAALTGRFLYIVGSDKSYEIASVNVVNDQVIRLTTPYTGPTDLFAPYTIRPAPAERKLIYYSEASLPEAWPALNVISTTEDGDDLTGLMAKGSFLYLLERRHIYRFTFQSDPANDGFTFLSSMRGCVNHRCWVVAEDIAYMLDEAGVHAFSGGQESEPISTSIQDIFRDSDSPYRVNWQASKWFHACAYPSQETVRFFVALSGEKYPRHALTYQYRLKRWWLEEYPIPVPSSCTGQLQSQRKVYLGGEARAIYAYDVGTLDGPNPLAGTVRGTVSSAALLSLTDGAAVFPASGVVRAPLVIVSGTGKGQRRQITQVSGTTLTISWPWLTLPDTTSVYQIGGISWDYLTGNFRWSPDEEETTRRLEVIYQPLPSPAQMDLRLYVDFSSRPVVMGTTRNQAGENGLGSQRDSGDLPVDLTKSTGQVQKRLSQHRELFTDGPRWVSLRMLGVSNADQMYVYEATLEGAVHV